MHDWPRSAMHGAKKSKQEFMPSSAAPRYAQAKSKRKMEKGGVLKLTRKKGERENERSSERERARAAAALD